MTNLRIVGEIYDPDEEKDRVEKQQNRAKIQQRLGCPLTLPGNPASSGKMILHPPIETAMDTQAKCSAHNLKPRATESQLRTLIRFGPAVGDFFAG